MSKRTRQRPSAGTATAGRCFTTRSSSPASTASITPPETRRYRCWFLLREGGKLTRIHYTDETNRLYVTEDVEYLENKLWSELCRLRWFERTDKQRRGALLRAFSVSALSFQASLAYSSSETGSSHCCCSPRPGRPGEVREPAVRRSAVPVLCVGRDVHNVARMQLARLLAPFLIIASSCKAEQDLSAALFCVVDVPIRCGSRAQR